MVSGSSTGISRNNSEFQPVRVVLPEPFAPAIKVRVGLLTARIARKRRLAPLSLGLNLTEALPLDRYSGSRGLGHLLRNFMPLSNHLARILQRKFFGKGIIPRGVEGL